MSILSDPPANLHHQVARQFSNSLAKGDSICISTAGSVYWLCFHLDTVASHHQWDEYRQGLKPGGSTQPQVPSAQPQPATPASGTSGAQDGGGGGHGGGGSNKRPANASSIPSTSAPAPSSTGPASTPGFYFGNNATGEGSRPAQP